MDSKSTVLVTREFKSLSRRHQPLEVDALAGAMEVGVTHEGERTVMSFDDSITIASVLEKMEIPPSTVLTIVGDQIVPHTSTITGDIEIELIIVSSGG